MSDDKYLPEGEYYCEKCQRNTKHEYLLKSITGKTFTSEDMLNNRMAFTQLRALTCVCCYCVIKE